MLCVMKLVRGLCRTGGCCSSAPAPVVVGRGGPKEKRGDCAVVASKFGCSADTAPLVALLFSTW